MKTSLIPTEKSLSDLVNEVKGMIAKDDTLEAIRFVRNHLPENSPKYDLLILLERRYESVVEDVLKGIISADNEMLEKNKVSHNLMDFLNILKEEDFSEDAATSAAEEERTEETAAKPEVRVGKTLYQIPNKMQLQEEVECKVWIAFDLETILQEVEKTDTDAVRDIRISNVMGVELFVHNNSDAFEISTYDSTEQIIEKGLPTEWTFYVTPLKEGKYPLILRISVIEVVDGEKVHKTKVLREVVQIVTEAEPLEEGIETKKAEGLVFAAPDDEGNKPKGGAIGGSGNGSGGAGTGGKKGATGAAGILKAAVMMAMVVFVGYSIQNPEFIGIGNDNPTTAANEIKDWKEVKKTLNPNELEHFIEKYPDTEFEALAMGRMEDLEEWNKVKTSFDTAGIIEYIENNPESDLKILATRRLAFLEEWQKVKVSLNPDDVTGFLNKKPDEDLENLAKKRLVILSEWLKIEPSTNPDDFKKFINKKPDQDLEKLAKARLDELNNPSNGRSRGISDGQPSPPEGNPTNELDALSKKRLALLEEWKKVKLSLNPVDVEEFIDKKPDKDLERLAKRRLAILNDWLSIKSSTKPSDFRTFLDKNPDEDLKRLAKKRLKSLTSSLEIKIEGVDENSSPKPPIPSRRIAEYPHPTDCDAQEDAAQIVCTEALIQKQLLTDLNKIVEPSGSAVVSFTITESGVQTKLQVASSGSHAQELDSVVRNTIRRFPKFSVGQKPLKKQIKIAYNETTKKWVLTILK